MRYYVNLVTRAVTAEIYEKAHITATRATRGDGDEIELQFHRNGTPIRLAVGYEVVFVGKSEGKFDQDPPRALASPDAWTRPGSDAGFYTASISYNGDDLADDLESGDDDDTNDLPEVELDAEFSWVSSTPGSLPRTSRRFSLTIDNDLWKGDETPGIQLPLSQSILKFGARGDGETDDTASFQAALDSDYASIFVPDTGSQYMISDQLLVPSNKSVIHDQTATLKRTDESVGAGDCCFYRNEDFDGGNVNIAIIGGIFDCNSAENERDDISGTPSYVGGVGFRFCNVQNLILRDVTIKDALAFSIHLGEIVRGQFDNLYFDNTTPPINNDGLHIGGGCSHIRARGIRANTTGDDLVAIITDEDQPFNMTEGAVDDILVENINGGSSAYRAVRLLGASHLLSNVTIRNVVGGYKTNTVLIGNEGLGTTPMVNILLEGIDCLKSPYNYDSQPAIFVATPVKELTLRRITRSAADTSTLALIQLDPSAGTLYQVLIDGVQTEPSTARDEIGIGCSVKQLNINNVQMRWTGGGSYGGTAFKIGSGTFNQINLSNVLLSGIQNGLSVVDGATVYDANVTGWGHETGVNSIVVQQGGGSSPVVDHLAITSANFAGVTYGVKLDTSSLKSLTISASKFRVVTSAFYVTGTIPNALRILVAALDQASISGWLSRSSSQSISLNGLCCPVDKTMLTPFIYDLVMDVSAGPSYYNGSSWSTL